MSLASRISDLTNAIATAVNARTGRVGASAYEIAVVNGYTGTQAQWLVEYQDTSNTDYAALFNSQLGTVPYTGIATEAQSGITQFATASEILAGTLSSKSISPLQLNAYLVSATGPLTQRRFTTWTALNSWASAARQGELAVLTQQTTTNGILYRSLWFSNGDTYAQPTAPLLVSNVTTLTDLLSLVNIGSTYANLSLDPGVTTAISGRTTAAPQSANVRDEWLYLGTAIGWKLWRGYSGALTFASGVTVRDNNSAFTNGSWVDGEQGHITFNLTVPAVGQYGLVATLPATAVPNLDVFIPCAYTGGSSTWNPGTAYIQTDGTLHPLSWSPGAGTIMSGTGNWKRKIG